MIYFLLKGSDKKGKGKSKNITFCIKFVNKKKFSAIKMKEIARNLYS